MDIEKFYQYDKMSYDIDKPFISLTCAFVDFIPY